MEGKMEFEEFAGKLAKVTGFDISQYKRPQMQRIIGSLMARADAKDYVEYLQALQSSSHRREEFRKYITINVTEFFRDPDLFAQVKEKIFPQIAQLAIRLKSSGSAGSSPEQGSRVVGSTHPYGDLSGGGVIPPRHYAVRIWSAGCATGEEPYTLAIMLEESKFMIPRYYLLATDIDAEAVKMAKEGVYPVKNVKNVTPHLLKKYFHQEKEGEFVVNEEIRKKVTFSVFNLLLPPKEGEFHLVLCRNVVIYFSEEAKERLYTYLISSLVPGGILFVGATENLLTFRNLGLEKTGTYFYRKL